MVEISWWLVRVARDPNPLPAMFHLIQLPKVPIIGAACFLLPLFTLSAQLDPRDATLFEVHAQGSDIYDGNELINDWAQPGAANTSMEFELNGDVLTLTVTGNNGWIHHDNDATPWEVGVEAGGSWTTELRVRLAADDGNGVVIWGANGSQRGIYQINTNDVSNFGVDTYDESDNTDGFHTFRMAYDSEEDLYFFWRDGVPLNLDNGSAMQAGTGQNRYIIGDCCSNIPTTSFELEYASYDTTGAYSPASSDDSDADGLPDEWEQAHFTNLDQGPSDDTDGDGATNIAEFILETEPNNANSARPAGSVALIRSNKAWDDPSIWSDGAAPSAGNAYSVFGERRLRAPADGGVFGGDSLTIEGEAASLSLNHADGSTVTIPSLVLDSSTLSHGVAGGDLTVDGSVTIQETATVSLGEGERALILSGPLGGEGDVSVQGELSVEDEALISTLELRGVGTTFSGDWIISQASVKAVTTGSAGSGNITLVDGRFDADYNISSLTSRLAVQGTESRFALDQEHAFGEFFLGETNIGELIGPGVYDFDTLSALDPAIAEVFEDGGGSITIGGDVDADGLLDSWERDQFGDTTSNNGVGDPDEDQLDNAAEFAAGSNPNKADSDDDGLSDFDEIETHKTDPSSADSDGDMLADADEIANGTSPILADTDADGLDDGVETGTGTFVDASDTGTDPNKLDSDEDLISDGQEVAGNTNPVDVASNLRASDDWPNNYEGDALPNDEQPDAGWEVNINDDAMITAAGGLLTLDTRLPADHFVRLGDGSSWVNSIQATDSWTVEVRTRILGKESTRAGEQGGLNVWASGAETTATGYLLIDTDAVHWGNNNAVRLADGVDNTDGFHTFRMSYDASAERFHIWRDSVLIGDSLEASNVVLALDWFLIGDSSSSFSVLADVDTIRWIRGVFPPIAPADVDEDGLEDVWEIANFDNLDQLPDGDADEDGLSNELEEMRGTDPNNKDTDGDGLEDGPEVAEHLTDPSRSDTDGDTLSDADEVNTHLTDPNQSDSDGDRLTDSEEVVTHMTDPNNADSDGDLYSDWAEIALGTQPDDPASKPDGIGRTLIASYDASSGDPLEVGWTTGAFLASPDTDVQEAATENGKPAWRNFDADGDANPGYAFELSDQDYDDMFGFGWRVTMVIRLEQGGHFFSWGANGAITAGNFNFAGNLRAGVALNAAGESYVVAPVGGDNVTFANGITEMVYARIVLEGAPGELGYTVTVSNDDTGELLSEQTITGFGNGNTLNNGNLSVQSGSSAGDFREALIRSYELESLKSQPTFGGDGGVDTDVAITGLSLADDNVNLTWTSSEGALYTIEGSTTLEADSFEPVATDITSGGATTTAIAESLSEGGASKFYRIRQQ